MTASEPGRRKFIIHHSPFTIARLPLRFAASALSGALMVGCFPNLNLNLLVWVACVPLLAALMSERKLGRAFLLGCSSGFVFLAGTCYWLIEVMEVYGKLAAPLAVGVWLLFAIVFAVFFGVFALGEVWVARRSAGRALLLSPFLWVAMELARTYLVTGFPWNLLGYAVQADGLRRLASFTAVYGLSFLAAVTSALLAGVFLASPRQRLAMALVVWLVLLLVGNLIFAPPLLPSGKSAALLVQPNVPLEETAAERWAPWRDRAPLDRLVEMTLAGLPPGASAAARPPLIVWAENPAPFYFGRDPILRAAVENMARRGGAIVVLNTISFGGANDAQPRNSAIVLDPQGQTLLQYDKIHLVPFGEYVPGWALPGYLGKITSEVGDFVPGSKYQVAGTPEGKIGVFICYEAIFPELVRHLSAAGADVLVNISNDAWYGDSAAAFQHLEMARLRAVENSRYLLRATNDGITAVIDPFGRVVSRIPRHRALGLAGAFDYLTRRTFYTEHGDVFAWLCVVISAGIAAFGGAQPRSKI